MFSCRRLGIARDVSKYTALTDGLVIVACVQKLVAWNVLISVSASDKLMAVWDRHQKHTVHCNNARTCDSGPRLPDKSWVKGLVVELETINWDRHLQCPARCSPLPAPQFPVVPSGPNNYSRVLVSRLSSGSPSDCDRVVCLPRNRGRIIAGHVWRGC